ncbi:TRAP transporter small permease subunit [Stappia sp. ES.058]|uniref:TRAP transporter small permease subunit n=1 Tax=Stappia sp. ES.058 TaxID=1881061 RepID=UPI00087BDFCD|nr:TRAP transporter small permease subunit [Stappia sp. ES.058]SDU32026.1 TRAP-type mannitol/chloroaromatic compound transport system, small permease component [Stappia sp. ES.058]
MKRLGETVGSVCALPGMIVGWLILPLIVSVCLGVLAAQLGINHLVDWQGSVPFFDEALTVNSMLDLQWHIFAMVVLFGGVYAYRDREHVSVDFLAAHFSKRRKAWVDMLCDLVFLLPFCAIIVWFGTKFAYRSYLTGEGSTYGGMIDRWFVKACIPAGFLLLGTLALARILSAAVFLFGRDANGSAADDQGRTGA